MAREYLWHRLRLHWIEKAPWVAVGCVAFTVHWAAGGSMEWLNEWVKHGHPDATLGLLNVAYLVLCLASFYWLYKARRGLFRPRTRLLRNERPEKRPHLILFLSNLPEGRPPLLDGVPAEVTLSGELPKDLDALVAWKAQAGLRWSWEMPLRSIAHHLGTLRTVTLLCSHESIRQVHWFAQIIARYEALHSVALRLFLHQQHDLPVLLECPTTAQSQGGWDFEHFDDLSDAVFRLLDDLRHRRISDEEIMIDFTGGQKVTSVVATAVTFNRPIKAQYVQTNPPHEVISYDILLGVPETGGVEI